MSSLEPFWAIQVGRTEGDVVIRSHWKIITLSLAGLVGVLFFANFPQTIRQRWFLIIIIIRTFFFCTRTLSRESQWTQEWPDHESVRKTCSFEISPRVASGQQSSSAIIKSWSTLCREAENCGRETFLLLLYLELVTPHVETNTSSAAGHSSQVCVE